MIFDLLCQRLMRLPNVSSANMKFYLLLIQLVLFHLRPQEVSCRFRKYVFLFRIYSIVLVRKDKDVADVEPGISHIIKIIIMVNYRAPSMALRGL